MLRQIDNDTTNSDAENDDAGWVTPRGSLLAPPPSPVARSLLLACKPLGLSRTRADQSIGQVSADGSSEALGDASRFLRATLADALSTSLATIAGQQHRPAGDSSSSSSSENNARHSGSSSGGGGMYGQISVSSGPAVVTASGVNTSSGLNTSSGDDRNSSGGNSGSAAPGESSGGPFLRQHHHHNQRRRSVRDAYGGLPDHMESGSGASRGDFTSHAMVLARLPPPREQSASSSSCLFSSCGERSARLSYSDDRKRSAVGQAPLAKKPSTRRLIKRQRSTASCSSEEDAAESGSSGTEGGYAGSASSNGAQQSSSSSSSESSLGDYHGPRSRMDSKLQKGTDDLQSRVASDAGFAFNLASRSCSPVSSTFSNSSSSDELEEEENVPVPPAESATRKTSRRPVQGDELASSLVAFASKMKRATERTTQDHNEQGKQLTFKTLKANLKQAPCMLNGRPAILSLGSDTMALCLSYLEPPEAHELLTMPLSRDWHSTFTQPSELWRVLCLSAPFKAKFDRDDDQEDDSSTGSEESLCPFPMHSNMKVKHLFGRYRLLYSSFIRCMRYLARIKDDALHGRPPSLIDNGGAGVSHHPFTANSKLKHFLARARNLMEESNSKRKRAAAEDDSQLSSGTSSPSPPAQGMPLGVSDSDTSSTRKRQKVTKAKSGANPNVKYGHSVLTQRLLGPAKTGEVGDVNLPWSCAIYSIVNWMAAFSDVQGIQTLCLRVLPSLLEDESQRTTAQRAGLTSIILRGMVTFPDSSELHTAAFHTIVLLARPLGGREGMLFHSSMVNSTGVFSNGSSSGKNGIAVMLDSMNRFASSEALQAMSCWSLVNIALATTQKSVLVKLGGISAVANAMMQHPYSAEVQFRALFALINLVIPSANVSEESPETSSTSEQLGEVSNVTEREILDENVGQITNLVVLAMKNFCSSQTILNRACLVLHNLSLTHDYHTTLLWTPNCYQMLEWCLANYPGDQVLQQSAAGTLHRLQMTLSGDEGLRRQFSASIQAQQQQSLEQAHREATLLRDQQEQHQQQVADQR